VLVGNYALPVTYVTVASGNGHLATLFRVGLYDNLSGPVFPQLGDDCFTLFSSFETPELGLSIRLVGSSARARR
jgi:hypothetical protein